MTAAGQKKTFQCTSQMTVQGNDRESFFSSQNLDFSKVICYGLGSHGIHHHFSTKIWENMFFGSLFFQAFFSKSKEKDLNLLEEILINMGNLSEDSNGSMRYPLKMFGHFF